MTKFTFDPNFKTNDEHLQSYKKIVAAIEADSNTLNKEDLMGFFAFVGLTSFVEIAAKLQITRQSVARWLIGDTVAANGIQKRKLQNVIEEVNSAELLCREIEPEVLADLAHFAEAAPAMKKLGKGFTFKDILLHLLLKDQSK